MRRIQSEPVPADELELAKNHLTDSFPLGFERAARRVQIMVAAERNKLPDDLLRQLVTALANITVADVQRAARTHLRPASCCLSVAGPKTKKSELEALVKASG